MPQGHAFEATDDQRRTVRAMSGFGVPHDDIATLLRIDPKTLRKHFRWELDSGSIEATAKVGQSLYRMATEGGSVAAAIFWMKARAGWREKHEVTVQAEMADSDGARQRVARRIEALVSRLPDDPVEASRVYQHLIQGRAE
ncbi:hypothetical protein [Roseomonas indoligenes]|uniref:Uncharacterized protein n=1 Tax=Roseomonas indoligenes TaxID=2820811 RepID=A0A940MWV1_9PROT|nr:hypothetical protein [Pararoseomonas indoligenes]MBP0495708.1 hypothetical protein [Pararoseomonas indoligenes]